MAGTFTVTGMSASEPSGQRRFGPITIEGSTIIGETLGVSLSNGDNAFSIPTGAVACWIVPAAVGGVSLTVRTSANASDAGLPISSLLPFGPYCFSTPTPASLIVRAGGAQASPLTIVFI